MLTPFYPSPEYTYAASQLYATPSQSSGSVAEHLREHLPQVGVIELVGDGGGA